ncbi:MAG: TetR/AcrR family transcriptional regulator [Spirochaetes bacterium]|jgi:AcrR family transcriptional regulator|nr:TetR/AcrR family transcriptional regulator [Spirochaetota bacterium]
MQVLKSEVRDSILRSAEKLFLKDGFEKVSMRSIAQTSGMTVGNVYRYFKNKDDIFGALVESLLGVLTEGLTHEIEPLNPDDADKLFEKYFDRFELFTSIVIAQRRSLILLFNKSHGTSYENEYNRFVGMMADHLRDHLTEMGCDPSLSEYNGFCDVLAHMFLQGVLKVLLNEPDKEAMGNIMQLLRMTVESIPGYMKFFGGDDATRD